jgi:hypothetical protein
MILSNYSRACGIINARRENRARFVPPLQRTRPSSPGPTVTSLGAVTDDASATDGHPGCRPPRLDLLFSKPICQLISQGLANHRKS